MNEPETSSARTAEGWRDLVMNLEARGLGPDDETFARATIQKIVSSAAFKHFSSGRGLMLPRELQVAWPVGILGVEHATHFKWGDHPRVAVLTHQNVARSNHARRWSGELYDGDAWENVQRALDSGTIFKQGKGNYFFYVDAIKAAKAWGGTIYTANGKVRLSTFLYADKAWFEKKRRAAR